MSYSFPSKSIWARIGSCCVAAMLSAQVTVLAQPPEDEDPARALEEAVAELERDLDRELELPRERRLPTDPETRRDIARMPVPGAELRLIDVSWTMMAAVGASTAEDEELEELQGGQHDPRQRGFTFQGGELALFGAVDPYFNAQATIVLVLDPEEAETEVELEEAFLTTQMLPWGLQVKGGHYFTEFGRINALHGHDWAWMDQPIINTRLFGPDGLRGPGARVAWLTPLPWYTELFLGVQNARGEAMVSFYATDEVFDDRPIAGLAFEEGEIRNLGDMLYTGRAVTAFDLTDEITAQVGASGLFGPNATGRDGQTFIYGGDVSVRWLPEGHFRGWPFVRWDTEIMQRHYRVDRDNAAFEDRNLRDWGLYTQVVYGFMPRWEAGLRYEYVTGSGEGAIARDDDPFRSDRQRISPLIAYRPSEFSRLRLQYNHDRVDHLDDNVHSVWFGVDILIGAHPPHRF